MTTATTQPEAQRQADSTTAQTRQLVGFSFYSIDPSWRRLPRVTRTKHGGELIGVINAFSKRPLDSAHAPLAEEGLARGRPERTKRVEGRLMVLTYSLVGLKQNVDFLIWRVGTGLEDLQDMSGAIQQTAMAGYLSTPYSYLSMTKRSTYVDKLDPDHQDRRRFITPAHCKYFFVYPFVKTREWYRLPFEQRQALMDEHIQVGNKYPSVRLHTTYSFGLDDQEFIVAFETDKPQDFLDLVMELRETKASGYTLRDTPIFSCIAKPFHEILQDLGG